MLRFARVVVSGYPRQVTQCGKHGRQKTFTLKMQAA